MNLEELKINPNPEPSELIKKIARSYLKKGEKINIFPQKVVYNNEKYYYVTFYYKSLEEDAAGILIVKEDGTVPLHKDVIIIRDYISDVDMGLENVFTYGQDWLQRPMKVWKKLQSVLEAFAKLVHASNDEELKKGYKIFCSIPQVMFETQNQLKEIIEKAKGYYSEITINYEITQETHEKVNKNYLHMMEIMKKQFEVQIETEKERKQFLQKLKKVIPLQKWVLYLRLLKFHRWLNADSATMAEYKEFKSDVSREKANEPLRRELIEKIRNPRG